MKKRIINIPGIASAHALETLSNNKIPFTYLGLDLSQRIIMQIIHREDQIKIIEELETDLKDCDSFMKEISQFIKTAVLLYRSQKNDSLNKDKKESLEKEKSQTEVTA